MRSGIALSRQRRRRRPLWGDSFQAGFTLELPRPSKRRPFPFKTRFAYLPLTLIFYLPTVLGDLVRSIRSERIFSVSLFPGSLSARLAESSSSSAASAGLSVGRTGLVFANFGDGAGSGFGSA